MKNENQVNTKKQLNSDLIVGAFGLLLGALVYFSTRDLSKLGGVFVDYVVIALVVLSILVIIKGFIKPEYIKFFDSAIERNNVMVGICILLLYLITLPIVGFLPSSYVFYFCFNMYLADDRFSKKSILTSIFLTLVVVTAFYFIFNAFLGVPLPTSMWSE
jgi:amino acid permease